MDVRLCCLALLLLTQPSRAAESSADWWNVERRVVERLSHEDVGAWARALEATAIPDDAGARMERFSVLARAGHEAALRELLARLSVLAPQLQHERWASAIDFLIGREDWEPARFAMEQLPHARPGWGYVFVRHWARHGDVDEIDGWLAAQAGRSRHWVRERLRFRKRLGTADDLVDEVEASTRRRPDDLEAIFLYLDVLSEASVPRDLAWIAERVRPDLAFDSYRLGRALIPRDPRVGIALLERAVAQPFTAADERAMLARWSCSLAADWDAEQMLRGAAKHRLMEAYLEVGEAARAQALLEELSARYPDGIPTGLLELAGQVQRSSGARVIEKRVRQAEEKGEGDPAYWLGRARYFAGRRKNEEAEQAFDRAWRLSADPFTAVRVIAAHENHVFRARGEAAALALLRRRFEEVPIGSRQAARIANLMLQRSSDRAGFPRPTDAFWWRYLAARPVWGEAWEERMLMRMAEHVERAGRAAFWERAAALACDAHPSRAKAVGWVMTRSDAHGRAVPLLEDAVERLESEDDRASARFTLFEAHLELGDRRRAEAIWPGVRQCLQPREIVEWHSRLALAAARAGDREAALRLWRARTNLDRGDLRYLDEMERAGVSLQTFYRRLAAADRASTAPARARAGLAK
ncbi:MAG: hypothetical protein ACYS0K_22360 [Planctomycetota bacterium]|jgi:tetratricopeptide (TPR) repeat protein